MSDRKSGVGGWSRRARSIAGALLMLSAGCGEEEPHASQQGPVVAGDSGVLFDSGFPPPVVAPPPQNLPPVVMDSGAMNPAFPFPTRDSGVPRLDAGGAIVRDAAPIVPVGDGGGTPTVDPVASNPCGANPEPLAANIRISELSLYQTVKIPLYRANAWQAMRNAAIVQGKKTLIRVFVEPGAGFTPHGLRALLSLESDGVRSVLAAERMIARASTDEAADSTFDFQVDGALIKGSTQVSVSVIETTCTPPAAGTGARLPDTGAQALNAEAINKLRVVVVPVTLGTRTPDTSEAQLTRMRDALRAYYPVADVEVTAHAPVSYAGAVQSGGSGWSEVLSLVGRTRQQDAPAASVYYFGLITPAATFRDYCRTGCVAGLAPQTVTVSRSNQIGLGVGYADASTVNTMVHELGHAHGLPHAPCTRGGSIQGADTRFPYQMARIGSWGWDSRSNKLMSPTMFYDVMSYCDPTWISDYYYSRIATRCKAVNNLPLIFTPEGQTAPNWHGIILHPDGSARWTGMSTPELPGEPVSVRVLDAQGQTLREIEVVHVGLSHGSDSFLYVPELEAGWAAIDLSDLGGQVLTLADIAPAAQ